jgi:hypothetical protein
MQPDGRSPEGRGPLQPGSSEGVLEDLPVWPLASPCDLFKLAGMNAASKKNEPATKLLKTFKEICMVVEW